VGALSTTRRLRRLSKELEARRLSTSSLFRATELHTRLVCAFAYVKGVEGIDVDQDADRETSLVHDEQLSLVRGGHGRERLSQGDILEDRRGRPHEGGRRIQRCKFPIEARFALTRVNMILDLAQQLRFVNDALCAACNVGDHDHSETALDEELDDVAHEDGCVDRNDPSAKRTAS